MMFHPRFSTLNRFSDGDLKHRTKARVARHLAACTKCRNVVQSIRGISREAPFLMLEEPTPSLLDKILERRARGDRVILPLADPSPARLTDWRALVAAAALVVGLVAAGVVLIRPGTLRADDSELMFAPERPARGATISVEYRPSGLLADNERLALRARFRRPHDRPYRYTTRQVTAAVLERGRDGLFRGSFQLPDSTVYAVFAAEDLSGKLVDGNGDALWELFTFEGEKPSYEALHQRYAEFMGRNWMEEVKNAQRMTQLYPERIASWSMLSAFQRWVPGGLGADSVLAVIASRADSLHQRFANDSTLSADDVAAMYWIALSDSQDSSVVEFWWDRLSREAPRQSTRVQHLARQTYYEFPHDLRRRLLRLEEIWNEYGAVHEFVAGAAYYAASRLGDTRAMSLWGPRVESTQPWRMAGIAEDFVLLPELREAGKSRLRQLISRLDAVKDSDRDLLETVTLLNVRHDRTRRSYFAKLGKALIDGGDLQAGIDTLQLALATGWDPDVFRTVAEAKLELGDSLGTLRMFSWIAVDPTTDSTTIAQVTEAALAVVDAAGWERQKMEGRTEMWRRLLPDVAPYASFLSDPKIADRDGRRVSMREFANGGTLLVALWDYMCGPPGERTLHQIQLTRDRWQGEQAKVLVVTSAPPTDALRELLEAQGLDVLLYHDINGEVKANLDWWVVPSYIVIDGEFRMRYKGDFEPAVRVVEALIARNQDIEAGRVLVAPEE